MKKLIIFFALLFAMGLGAQDWFTTIYVKGSLPEGTNTNTFKNQVKNAVNNNLSDSTYFFDIRIVATEDTTTYPVVLEINATVLPDENLKTFAVSVKNFFDGKFESAYIKIEYWSEIEL